ncbi:MAG: hypothetical protein KQH83_10070 [Actinobacteria bacterium]|nr:hypothetical protein [Actinomycetota bacterium]
MRRTILTVLLLGLLAAACGTEAGDGAELPPSSEPTVSDGLPLGDDGATSPMATGPGISVADALASTLEGPLLVNGYVFVYADGSVVLADVIAESFPPQPAGATVTVEGLDLMAIALTEGPADTEIEITAWTDMPVQVLGRVVDGTLAVDPAASA